MAQTTIERFASELKMPSGVLLEQLAKAGVAGKKEGDKLSELDKTRLLDYLRKQHGGLEQKKKITLTRRQTSEIKAADSTGRARTIQVEVRKKRVFVKRDGAEAAPAAEEAAPPQPVVSAVETAAREEEARKAQAQIAKQQEEVMKKARRAKKVSALPCRTNSFARFRFPRPSPLRILRTRCRSRPPRSSRQR